MATPVIEEVLRQTFSPGSAKAIVTMPADVPAGQLLLVVMMARHGNGSPAIATPTEWAEVGTVLNLDDNRLSFFAKAADGDEGGTTVEFTTNNNAGAITHLYRISGWGGTVATDIDASLVGDTGGTVATIPSVTAGWGSDTNLFLAVVSQIDDNSQASIGTPTNYTNQIHDLLGGLQPACMSTWRRALTAASDDPSDVTVLSDDGANGTLVIKPSAAGTALLRVETETIQSSELVLKAKGLFQLVEEIEQVSEADSTLVVATLDRAISANGDDGTRNESGTVSANFPTMLIGDPFAEQEGCWCRVANITVPQGALIAAAYITFVADDTGLFAAGAISADIFGVDEDDHAAPTSPATYDADHAIHTAASATWAFNAAASGNLQTVSIAPIVQEIVDRPGWVSGNDMGFHIACLDTNVGVCQELVTFDHATLSAGIIHIEYVVGVVGPSILKLETENLQFSESMLRTRILTRIYSETLQTSESVLRARNLLKLIGETLEPSEASIRVRSLLQLLNETTEIDEANLANVGLLRIISDPLNISEIAFQFKGLMRLISDFLELDEQTSALLTLTRLVDEVLDVDESILKLQSMIRVHNEILNIDETDLIFRALRKVIGESINLDEAEATVRGLIRIADEELSLLDNTEYYRGIFRIISENLDVSEQDLISIFGSGLVHVISEAVSIPEADLRFMVLVRQIAEGLGLTEVDLRARSLTRAQSENENLQEAAARIMALLRTHDEGSQITEADSWVRGIFKIVTETLETAEGIISKLAAAITGILKGWRTFAPKNRELGGDRTYEAGDRDYTTGPRDHSN